MRVTVITLKLHLLFPARSTITAILNKITPENFKEMSVQILQQEFSSRERLNLAADHIYEKAVLEPIYSQTYANLCKVGSKSCALNSNQ